MVPAADRTGLAEFLTRLLRLDPAAVVRLRRDPDGARVWAMLPFRVLVCRPLAGVAEDATYGAADLLATLSRPRGRGSAAARRRDEAWRWPLPPSEGQVVERIPVAEVVRLAAAAARTVRTATTEGIGGRTVGERVLRDALLDHVAIVVTTPDDQRIEIPQRMVQALVRMGLIPLTGQIPADPRESDRSVVGAVTGATTGDGQVAVRSAMRWIGLSSPYGSAWYRPISPLRLELRG